MFIEKAGINSLIPFFLTSSAIKEFGYSFVILLIRSIACSFKLSIPESFPTASILEIILFKPFSSVLLNRISGLFGLNSPVFPIADLIWFGYSATQETLPLSSTLLMYLNPSIPKLLINAIVARSEEESSAIPFFISS